MFNSFITVIGSVMLALGVCSPMISWKVNQEAPGMILAGIVLVCAGLWLDRTEDKRKRKRRNR